MRKHSPLPLNYKFDIISSDFDEEQSPNQLDYIFDIIPSDSDEEQSPNQQDEHNDNQIYREHIEKLLNQHHDSNNEPSNQVQNNNSFDENNLLDTSNIINSNEFLRYLNYYTFSSINNANVFGLKNDTGYWIPHYETIINDAEYKPFNNLTYLQNIINLPILINITELGPPQIVSSGITLLMLKCYEGDLNAVRSLLDNNATPFLIQSNPTSNSYRTALYYALISDIDVSIKEKIIEFFFTHNLTYTLEFFEKNTAKLTFEQYTAALDIMAKQAYRTGKIEIFNRLYEPTAFGNDLPNTLKINWLIKKAKILAKHGDYPSSHKTLYETVNILPDQDQLKTLEVSLLLGKLSLERENHKHALEFFLHALSIQENNLDALLGIASTCYAQGKLDEAIEQCNVILNLNLDHIPALALIAMIHYDIGNYEFAKNSLVNKKFDPTIVQNSLYLGIATNKLGKYKIALQCFDNILKCNPEHVPTLTHKAYTLTRLKRFNQAETLLDQAYTINPMYPQLLWAMQQYGKIHDCYSNFIEMYSRIPITAFITAHPLQTTTSIHISSTNTNSNSFWFLGNDKPTNNALIDTQQQHLVKNS